MTEDNSHIHFNKIIGHPMSSIELPASFLDTFRKHRKDYPTLRRFIFLSRGTGHQSVSKTKSNEKQVYFYIEDYKLLWGRIKKKYRVNTTKSGYSLNHLLRVIGVSNIINSRIDGRYVKRYSSNCTEELFNVVDDILKDNGLSECPHEEHKSTCWNCHRVYILSTKEFSKKFKWKRRIVE